jgi:hypothetical protein
MPPNPHCTLVGNTDFNELPPDILNIKTKEDPTHTSQSNSSSVTHHCMSQPKSSAAPLPRVSKLMSSAAVHRTSQPKSSTAPPPPHVSKPNKSYTKDHHQSQKPKKKPVVSAPSKSNERPNKNPHIWPSPVDDLPTVPPKIPPPNRPSLFTANEAIQTPSNQAPMLPSQVIIRYPTAPSTKDLETDQQRRSATTKQHRDERTKLTEKENKNMTKLPSQTNPPNTTYLRPRPPTGALRDAVSLVANWQQPDPEHCKFKFDISPEAAEHNLGIIRGHQYDLNAALKAEGGTALRYGSEFKPPLHTRPPIRKPPDVGLYLLLALKRDKIPTRTNNLPCQTMIHSTSYRQRQPQVSKRPTRKNSEITHLGRPLRVCTTTAHKSYLRDPRRGTCPCRHRQPANDQR